MIEPGTVATLHGLVSKLVKSIKDRKTASELLEIQRMIGTFQTEHFRLQQESLQLQTHNSELQKKIAVLEARVAQREQHGAQAPAEMCPFCRHAAGELVDFVPHEIPDCAEVGLKQGRYLCSNCGKEFRKDKET